jgi:hypothetical protein
LRCSNQLGLLLEVQVQQLQLLLSCGSDHASRGISDCRKPETALIQWGQRRRRPLSSSSPLLIHTFHRKHIFLHLCCDQASYGQNTYVQGPSTSRTNYKLRSKKNCKLQVKQGTTHSHQKPITRQLRSIIYDIDNDSEYVL